MHTVSTSIVYNHIRLECLKALSHSIANFIRKLLISSEDANRDCVRNKLLSKSVPRVDLHVVSINYVVLE